MKVFVRLFVVEVVFPNHLDRIYIKSQQVINRLYNKLQASDLERVMSQNTNDSTFNIITKSKHFAW